MKFIRLKIKISDYVARFENIENEHSIIMLQISKTLRSKQSDKASSYRGTQSRSSNHLSNVTKMKYLYESVRFKTKLKCHDAESKIKAEMFDSTVQFSTLSKEELDKLPTDDTNMFIND
jgi:hypothetical protein